MGRISALAMDMTCKCCSETATFPRPNESKGDVVCDGETLPPVDRTAVIRFIRKSFRRSLSPFMTKSNISDFVLEQMDCDTFLIYVIQPDCLGLVLDLDQFQRIMTDLQFLWKLMVSDDPVPQVLFRQLMGSLDNLLKMLHQDELSVELNEISSFGWSNE